MTLPPPDQSPGAHLPLDVRYSTDELSYLATRWRLTTRQRETLALILAWKVPKEVARALGVETSRARKLVDEIRKGARLQDGADGIRRGAAEAIAHYRATRREREPPE